MRTTAVLNVNDNFDNTEIDIDSATIDNENGWISDDVDTFVSQLPNAVNDDNNVPNLTIQNMNSHIDFYDDLVMKKSIETLIYKRESWEQNEYLRSNEKLYGILTEAMELFCQINGTDPHSKVLRTSFDRVAKEMGYSFSQSKHYTYRVVNVVFGKNVEPKRISEYARVLKCALDDKIIPARLIAYIDNHKGIRNIRARKKENEMTRCEKGKAILLRKPLTFIKNDTFLGTFKMRDYVDGVLLFATYDESENGFNVLALIQRQSAINSAFENMASIVTDQEVAELNDSKIDGNDKKA